MSANRRGKRSTKTARRSQSAFIPPPPKPKPSVKSQPAPATVSPPPLVTEPRLYPWDLRGLSQEAIVMPATADESAMIRKLEVQISEMNISLKFIKWIGAFLVLSAVGFFGFEYTAVQRLVRIEDAILALQKDAAEMRSNSKERNRQITDSLDRIEKSLAQNHPAPEKTPR